MRRAEFFNRLPDDVVSRNLYRKNPDDVTDLGLRGKLSEESLAVLQGYVPPWS